MTRRLAKGIGLVASVVALAGTGGVTGVQATAQQASRDRAAASSPTGTGTIAGAVHTSETPARPVRRAIVTLASSAAASPRVLITDDDGRFAFDRLPGGSFSLMVDKPAFVRMYYGGTRPGHGPAVPIALADGQRVDVSMTLVHGAAIAGAIVDAAGRPAVQTSIQVTPVEGGAPQSASTDDRGMFRVFGLVPGGYTVFAAPRLSALDADLHAVTVEDVRWAQARAAGTLAAGAPTPPAEPAVGFARVYFPGTTVPADADVLALAAGEERTISFALRMVRTARIDGTVTDPSGAPVQTAQIYLVPKKDSPANNDARPPVMSAGRIMVTNGLFTLLSVPPGRYTIVARGGPAAAATPMMMRSSAPGAAPWWGEADLTVDGVDQSSIAISMQPSVTLAGRLVFEGAAKPPEPMTRVLVALSPADAVAAVAPPAPSAPLVVAAPTTDIAAEMSADGTFTISNIPPGRYRLRAPNPGTAWTLKSSLAEGKDAIDVPLEVLPGHNIAGVTVTFTDQPTRLTGVLYDAAGRGTPEFSIVVFSSDRGAWTEGSRRIRATRPTTGGGYQLTGLPPGEYFLAAVRDYDAPDLRDPAFLEALAASAYKITLGDGEQKQQDLRIR